MFSYLRLSAGVAALIYTLMAGSALLAALPLAFSSLKDAWFLKTYTHLLLVFACTYAAFGVLRLKKPGDMLYRLRVGTAVIAPLTIGIGFQEATGVSWGFVDLGVFVTLVLHTYQMRVAHARGFVRKLGWIPWKF